MTAVARVISLDLRTIAPNRLQVLVTPLLIMGVLYTRPEVILPVLVLLSTSYTAGYPFQIADRSDLDTLYAVLPLTRRSLLLGRYAGALATFAVTAAVGIPVSLLFAQHQHVSLGAHTLAVIAAISWAVFALNISIQFPLYVRFGYTRAGMLATTLPITLATFAAIRANVDHLSLSSVWLILLAAGGVVLFCASVAVALALDPRRERA